LQFAVSLTHNIITDLYHKENYRRLKVALALKANNYSHKTAISF